MLDQLRQLGYDVSWQDRASVDDTSAMGSRRGAASIQPGSTEPIDLLAPVSAVRIPAGTAFDPGGIGKGLAADLVTEFLVANGATCTSVELGGDLRFSGRPWFGPDWRIQVANPFDDRAEIAAFSTTAGAVATSSTLRRRWMADDETRHHLLDSRTGRSATTDLVSVTTCAASAWWAEVAAKVALMAGSESAVEVLRSLGTPGIAVTADGFVYSTDVAPAPVLTGHATEGART